MVEALVLYGGKGGSILYGGGLFLYGGGSWRPGILSLVQKENFIINNFNFNGEKKFSKIKKRMFKLTDD